jgi:hypothetical protein
MMAHQRLVLMDTSLAAESPALRQQLLFCQAMHGF